jgi:hypothetical protein
MLTHADVSRQHEAELLSSLLHTCVIPYALAHADRGLLHLSLCLLNRTPAAAAALWLRAPSIAALSRVDAEVGAHTSAYVSIR